MKETPSQDMCHLWPTSPKEVVVVVGRRHSWNLAGVPKSLTWLITTINQGALGTLPEPCYRFHPHPLLSREQFSKVCHLLQ